MFVDGPLRGETCKREVCVGMTLFEVRIPKGAEVPIDPRGALKVGRKPGVPEAHRYAVYMVQGAAVLARWEETVSVEEARAVLAAASGLTTRPRCAASRATTRTSGTAHTGG